MAVAEGCSPDPSFGGPPDRILTLVLSTRLCSLRSKFHRTTETLSCATLRSRPTVVEMPCVIQPWWKQDSNVRQWMANWESSRGEAASRDRRTVEARLGADGSGNSPRRRREARRRYSVDEASRMQARGNFTGGRRERAVAGRRARRKAKAVPPNSARDAKRARVNDRSRADQGRFEARCAGLAPEGV